MTNAAVGAPSPVLRFSLGEDLPTIQQASTAKIEHPPTTSIGLVALQGPIEVHYGRAGESVFVLPNALFVSLRTIGPRVTSAEVNPQMAPLDEAAAIALCEVVTDRVSAAAFRLDPNVTIAAAELPYYLGESNAALSGGVRARRLVRGQEAVDISIRRQSSPAHAVAQGAPRDWYLVRVEVENAQLVKEALATV